MLQGNQNSSLLFDIISLSDHLTLNNGMTYCFLFYTGAYRQFTFSFVDPEDDSFLIDQQSGIITLNRILDREVRSEYNLTLKVSDPLQPNLFTISNLIIDVLDENDNEPMFEHDLYNVTVSENVAVRSVILRVRALSADEGLNALVTYAIVSGNEHSKFAIDGVTGMKTAFVLSTIYM